MLKNDKGVSLLTVVITIVVMIILISITISSSITSIEETNLTKIENEIKNLKDAVNVRITNYERNETLYPIIGEKIGDEVFVYIKSIENLSSDEKTNILDKVSAAYNAEKQSYYRLVGKVEAEKLGVESIDADHYYIVDYYDGEVYGPVKL